VTSSQESIASTAQKPFAVVFMGNTATYCVHADGCKMATENESTNRHRADVTFASIEEARDWCDQDEWEKRSDDKPKKGIAEFRVCACTKRVPV